MRWIESEARIPTEMELKKIYGFTTFPNGKTDTCCGGGSHYLMDSITHRVFYHKQTLKEAIRELEAILEEMKT